MFIVFEGLDGCGKSTHARLLSNWLKKKGKKVYLTAEPTKGPVGRLIREILSGAKKSDPLTLALLFTADRVKHAAEINKALKRGEVVISDRYYHSTVAYQGAQGLDRRWLLKINSFAPEPDIVLFLDVPPQKAEERAKSGEIFEKKQFLAKVRGQYMKFKKLKIIDATTDRNKTQEKIRKHISPA
jgi:dTMP kinase